MIPSGTNDMNVNQSIKLKTSQTDCLIIQNTERIQNKMICHFKVTVAL